MELNIRKAGETTPLKIEMDPTLAITIKLQEFDKLIAEAEATVANLKVQKVTFIYETNIVTVENDYKAKQQPLTGPVI